MIAQLVALSDSSSILLDKPVLLIGRHPECDIQIDSRKVSRRHCCIALVAEYLLVRDLGSTNGIRINGTRVTEGRLTAGDELMIGSHRYQVKWGAPDGSQRSPLPGLPMPANDAALEECDEPVPLADPEDSSPQPENAVRKAMLKPPTPMIIPDDIELAPVSDLRPPVLPPLPPADPMNE